MRKLIFPGMVFLVAGLLWLMGPPIVFAQGKTPDVKPSHADRLSSFEGPQSCTPCHAKAAKEVANSLHYIQAYEPKFLVGWEKGKLAGQALTY